MSSTKILILELLHSVGPFAIVAVSFVLYAVFLSIYRLYISPISKFPGPKITALTGLYEAYYNIVQGGKFTFKIRELHGRYGMERLLAKLAARFDTDAITSRSNRTHQSL